MSDPVALTLGQKQTAICAAIKDGLPDVQACEPLGRQLSPDGLSRAAVRLPAVYVTCAGMETRPMRISALTGITMNFRYGIWTAFLVVSDSVDPIASTELLERLVDLVVSDNFAGLGVTTAMERVENLYKGDVGKIPVCIYAFRFSMEA